MMNTIFLIDLCKKQLLTRFTIENTKLIPAIKNNNSGKILIKIEIFDNDTIKPSPVNSMYNTISAQ